MLKKITLFSIYVFLIDFEGFFDIEITEMETLI